jgi:flagella basal body P-ring formation protein FlgA
MKFNLWKILSFLTFFLAAQNAFCQLSENSIAEGAKVFLQEEIRKQHSTVDPRTISVKILDQHNCSNRTCSIPVKYYFPIYSNINYRATLIAECKDNVNNWKIYIPVNIKFFAHAISTKKSLPKLHVINKEDLVRKKINVLNLKNPYFVEPNQVVGLILKTSVKQDTVLTSNLLEKVEYGA